MLFRKNDKGRLPKRVIRHTLEHMKMHRVIRSLATSMALLTFGSGCAPVAVMTNACVIVTQEMATSALGTTVGKGANGAQDYANGSFGVSSCEYYDAQRRIGLIVSILEDRDPKVVTDHWNQIGGAHPSPFREPVSDLGDKAMFMIEPKHDTVASGPDALVVLKGTRLYRITVYGKMDVRAIEKSVAQEIFATEK